jgi:hypothetical protein
MSSFNALFADIDERARVAYLETEREMALTAGPDPVTEHTRDLFRMGFLAGFKVAMHKAIKMRLGVDHDGTH